jgi:hypothetical protein
LLTLMNMLKERSLRHIEGLKCQVFFLYHNLYAFNNFLVAVIS